jgi:hypothetical protein
MIGAIRMPERRLECQLAVKKVDGLHVITEIASALGTSTDERDEEFSVTTPEAEFPDIGSLHLYFDQSWVLQAGSATFADNDESIFGGESCETQVTWQAVIPSFGPENDRGGR